MITTDRYEVIKKWGNYIFIFHGKEANQENKDKFKKLLQKIILTNEFNWAVSQSTKSVEITFALGKIEVQTVSNRFLIRMDDETKQTLQSFKEKMEQSKEQPSMMISEGESDNSSNKEKEEEQITSSLHQEPEPPVLTKENDKEKEKEDEPNTAENSIFLDFIGAEEKEWM